MKRTFFLLVLACGLLTAFIRFETAQSQTPQHVEIKIDPKVFDDYVGVYTVVSNPEFALSFWREGDKYFLQATDQGRIDIYPESDHKFFLKIIEAQATFVRDAQGKVTSVIWRQNGVESEARKTSNQPAVQPNLPFDRREVMI